MTYEEYTKNIKEDPNPDRWRDPVTELPSEDTTVLLFYVSSHGFYGFTLAWLYQEEETKAGFFTDDLGTRFKIGTENPHLRWKPLVGPNGELLGEKFI